MTSDSDQIKPVAGPTDGPRSITAIIADLSKPLAQRHLKTRRQGGADLTYIEWHTAVRYLDHYAAGWSYNVRSVQLVSSLVTVIASISIPSLEGIIIREATGCEDVNAKGYGDAVSNAEAMALKRAASKFGLGLYLYSK
jgi:Rad52/22 family double-strand break repair protein